MPAYPTPTNGRTVGGYQAFQESDDPARPLKPSEMRGDGPADRQAIDAWHVSTWNQACSKAWDALPKERRKYFLRVAREAEKKRQAARREGQGEKPVEEVEMQRRQ